MTRAGAIQFGLGDARLERRGGAADWRSIGRRRAATATEGDAAFERFESDLSGSAARADAGNALACRIGPYRGPSAEPPFFNAVAIDHPAIAGLRLPFNFDSVEGVLAWTRNNLTRLARRLRGGGPRRFPVRHSRARLAGSCQRLLARTFASFFNFWTRVACQAAHAAERRALVLCIFIAQRYRCREPRRANSPLGPRIEIGVLIERESASLPEDGPATDHGQFC